MPRTFQDPCSGQIRSSLIALATARSGMPCRPCVKEGALEPQRGEVRHSCSEYASSAKRAFHYARPNGVENTSSWSLPGCIGAVGHSLAKSSDDTSTAPIPGSLRNPQKGKLCRAYPLCGSKALSLTQGLVVGILPSR